MELNNSLILFKGVHLDALCGQIYVYIYVYVKKKYPNNLKLRYH